HGPFGIPVVCSILAASGSGNWLTMAEGSSDCRRTGDGGVRNDLPRLVQRSGTPRARQGTDRRPRSSVDTTVLPATALRRRGHVGALSGTRSKSLHQSNRLRVGEGRWSARRMATDQTRRSLDPRVTYDRHRRITVTPNIR